jgi:putative ATP-binding cassette transporter
MSLIQISKINQNLQRLGHSIAALNKSRVGPKARFLAISLLVLTLCITAMNVANSYVARNLFSAIERQEMRAFSNYAWLYAGVFLASTLTAVLFRFSEERLGLLWREWLTRRFISLYMNKKIYLHLSGNDIISNPDQRIAEDVRSLTVTSLSFILMMLNSTITAISFSGVLWSISPKLFVVSVLYAVCGSALTIFLGKPLIKLSYRQSDFEADFRSQLIKIRDNATEINSSNQESVARDQVMDKFNRVISNQKEMISISRNVGFFTTGYNYMIQLIPILVVAPIFIESGVEFGIIGQSSMAFATMVGAFSLIITQFQSISSYSAVFTRLGEMVAVIEAADTKEF